jgi:hypothetical protein
VGVDVDDPKEISSGTFPKGGEGFLHNDAQELFECSGIFPNV